MVNHPWFSFQSFVIPVSVRVWDVNDNAPAWAGAPYHVRLSELTAVGARVLRVRATDADQPGPHATIVYSVLPGPHSVSADLGIIYSMRAKDCCKFQY